MSQPLISFNDGVQFPQLGLGVFLIADDQAATIVQAAIAAGYRHIDTAAIYGNEAGVGEGLRRSEGADQVKLATKLWNADQGYDSALRAFDASSKRLGREVLDLYLIHWPAPKQDLYVDSWKALVRLREEGRVRSIGVSNFQPEHLRRIIDATGVTPAVNQIELHPRFQQRLTRATHEALGVATESWSPLGRGRMLDDAVIGDLAAKHARTPAQIIIRWHLDQGLMVIPKTTHPERLKANIGVLDFHLDAGDLAAIAGLDDPDGRIGPNPETFD